MLRIWQQQQHYHHHHFHNLLPCRLSCLADLHLTLSSLQAYRASRAVAAVESTTEFVEYKSKNQRKREADRSVDWAIEFSAFSDSQLRRAIRWGGLQDEVFDGVKVLRTLRSHTKSAKRRQLNLVGRMLRNADPSLMEVIIKAIRNGKTEQVFENHGNKVDSASSASISSAEDFDSGDEMDNKVTAERWLEGLLSGDSDVSAEIYAIRSVDFNRQELRSLLKRALSRRTKQLDENHYNEDMDNDLKQASPSVTRRQDHLVELRNFLEDLASKAHKK